MADTIPKLFNKQLLSDAPRQAARAAVWSDCFASSISRYIARGPTVPSPDYAASVTLCATMADLAVAEFDKRYE